jgi:DNA-binding response OmpR family regulator
MVKKHLQLLIVDDEPSFLLPLAEVLEEEGYVVSTAADGREAIDQLTNASFNVILTDLKMPHVDGLEVMAAARELQPDALLILMTAYGSLQTAVAALRYGAFDYLLKPIPIEEILASIGRAEALLVDTARKHELLQLMEEAIRALKGDRGTGNGDRTIRTGNRLSRAGIVLDIDHRMVKIAGRLRALTPTESDVLALLMTDAGRSFSSEEILESVKGYVPSPEAARAAVRVYISRLRQKIEANPKDPRYLLTVRGTGYMFSDS